MSISLFKVIVIAIHAIKTDGNDDPENPRSVATIPPRNRSPIRRKQFSAH
jgi:hypothetical protein